MQILSILLVRQNKASQLIPNFKICELQQPTDNIKKLSGVQDTGNHLIFHSKLTLNHQYICNKKDDFDE